MKTIILFILALHCVSALATTPRRDLLFCLGQEEQKLHTSKRTGPQYFLNQYFINEAASTGIFKLKDSYYEQICERREFPPSIGLIKSILIDEKKIFEKVNMGSAHLDALYDSGLDTLVENAPHIFFQFLSIVQSHTRYAHCFKENIPELHSLMNNYQYLEEDTEPGQLIKNKKDIRVIFDKLKHLDAIYDRCEKKFIELQKKIKTN